MTIPDVIFAVPVTAGCLVLAWAGLEKARDRKPLTGVIAEMGIPQQFAGFATAALVIAELATVLIVIAGVPAYFSALLLALLGLCYAGAGAWSLLSGKDVSCACFGAAERRLGWRQLAALPLWLLASWSVTRMPAGRMTDRLAIAAAAFVLLTILRAIPALRRSAAARQDRRAFLGGS